MNIKQEFIDAVFMGREIEFSYCGQHYFESRRTETDWFIYCEEEKYTQHFSSPQELIKNTMLQKVNINEIWEHIIIDCIL
ncbi:hypothetical protein [Lawsonibacter faecis]|uniref:Uncharacterized protein n=1 Tax=Lawsonibacter faecis TaxID=2763052 RepID=A0A8J6MDE2_9FIRM|nr:hypothetical protein [Lawsonibacter faecis]MBC5737554.1 hypothetical protein [Lawsonibacter faecis]